MSVWKPRNSRFFHFDFVHRGVRRHGSTGQTTRRLAEAVERRERARLAEGPAGRRFTLDEAAGIYFAEVARHQPSARTTRSQLRNLLSGLGKTAALEEIDTAVLARYVARRRARAANATANREIELFRRLRAYLATNHEAEVGSKRIDWKALKHPEPRERVRELTGAEEARLMAALPEDFRALAAFALMSGARLGALIALRWSDLDLSAGRAVLRRKGGGVQVLPLTPAMTALLANRPRGAPEVFTYALSRRRPPYAKGARRPFTPDGWRKAWAAALTKAEIADFRFHDLRHTAATRMLRATGNLRAAQKLLGHADVATTARYAHLEEADQRAAMAAMAAAVKEGKG